MSKIYNNPQDVAFSFYHYVGKQNYKKAFGCLAPNFQQRIWPEGIQRFVDGYQFNKGVSKIEMPQSEKRKAVEKDKIPAGVDVFTFFRQSMDVITHPSVEGLALISSLHDIEKIKGSNKEARLGNIDDFAEAIKNNINDVEDADDFEVFVEGARQFKELLEELKGDQAQIDDFRLSHLLGDAPVNAAIFLTKINYEENKEYFGSYENTIDEQYKVQCVEDKKRGWLIHGIRRLGF